jgi:hypothetical protein
VKWIKFQTNNSKTFIIIINEIERNTSKHLHEFKENTNKHINIFKENINTQLFEINCVVGRCT